MRSLISLFLGFILLSCSSHDPQVDYTLSWRGDGLGVSISMESRKDTFMFTYGSDAGGQTDQMSWIQHFNVTRGDVLIDSASRSFAVVPADGGAEFSYVVRCTLPDDYGSPGGCLMDMFRPDIDEKMMFSRTENIFLLPAAKEDAEAQVSVTWESAPPYPVFCLYNPDGGTSGFKGKVSDISFSVMAGDPLLTVDTVVINGHENYLVTALRKNAEENKSALKPFFRTFYSSITAFWEEKYEAPYSLLIFPFRNNTFEVTGNGFANGFVSRYDATADTILTQNRRDVFTHEMGHKWLNNGTVWFAEGFNEMQTGYQLVASGLEKPDYFAHYFNNALSGLQRNPYKNVPGEKAEDRFWDDGDYTWLLYWRGFCYAFHLAGLFEKATGIPNAWRPMMQAVKPFLADFSADKFIDAMAEFIDRDLLEKDYRKYIVEGRDFDFLPENMPSGCRIIRHADGTPELLITDSIAFSKHFN